MQPRHHATTLVPQFAAWLLDWTCHSKVNCNQLLNPKLFEHFLTASLFILSFNRPISPFSSAIIFWYCVTWKDTSKTFLWTYNIIILYIRPLYQKHWQYLTKELTNVWPKSLCTLFEMFLALSAYTRVFLLSSLWTSAGLMWAIITVWQLPFRVSFNNLWYSIC